MTENGKNKAIWDRIKTEAKEVEVSEPFMSLLLKKTILSESTNSFEDAVATTIAYRLIQSCGANPDVCINGIKQIILDAFKSNELEMGHTMREAVEKDVLAFFRRDPACKSLLEVILFFKGFAALVCHRVAHRNFSSARFTALWLQSQASAAFGVDIHPSSSIGAGVLFDHGTGVVIGETATVGDGCTLLHSVTLGGTGKEGGDRHPKVGNNVLIGAGTSVLGNIKIGDRAKIGAGSVVLKPIPHGATAVGSPAKIIGWSKESKPGSEIDMQLHNVDFGKAVANSSNNLTSLNKCPQDPVNNFLKSSPKFDEYLCPYRLFPCFPCISSLQNLLRYEGSSDAEIGEVIFELLHNNKGFISAEVFRDKFSDIAKRYTKIDPARCDLIAFNIYKNFAIKNSAAN